ncbi:hypothetical protein MN116_007102 [Schistosoma mekongi]|uniref:PARG helical domain-containing protein n=1 Tax=Schistosoma mekongi TaxID=38744 RepID=A0AAE1Z970_SCHME|nr:hypothetical protein MN116_007102 [Schistosoma mekongi]
MCFSKDILLPCDLTKWDEIKCKILHIIQEKVSLSESLSLLDIVGCLFRGSSVQNEPTKLFPTHSTYVGLGNFIYLCMHQEERKHFEANILPYILKCVVISEQLAHKYRSSQCLQNEKCCTLLPYDLISSIIASSLLCLLPINPLLNQWLNNVNFTHIFLNILNSRFSELEKLRCVISYLGYCRSCDTSSTEGLMITRRFWSHSDLPKCITSDSVTHPVLVSKYDHLVNVLSSVHLPYLFVDDVLTTDQMASRTHLPLVHFMGSRVGGELFSGGISQTEYLFSRYPDLISIIPIHPRLVDGEALWVDHVRGPFLPKAIDLSTRTSCHFEKSVKWRRFILLNTDQYPAWLSEIQYSKQCCLRQIILVASGLFPNELKYDSNFIRPRLFSSLWWNYFTSKSDEQNTQSTTIKPIRSSSPSTYRRNTEMKWIQAKTTDNMLKFVDNFVSSIMCDIQNSMKIKLVDKSSHCDVNKYCLLSQKPQITYEYESYHSPLNVVSSIFSTSQVGNRLRYNITGESNENHCNSGDSTTPNCSPQLNCIQHPEMNKPFIYHYTDNFVEEPINYAQKLSNLHAHHLHFFVDSLIYNAFQNALRLISWSNQMSKQVLHEAKYLNMSLNHTSGSGVMELPMNDYVVDGFNKTKYVTTNTTRNQLRNNYPLDRKCVQYGIDLQIFNVVSGKKYLKESLDESQLHQITNTCLSPDQLIPSYTKSAKVLPVGPSFTADDNLPCIFITEELFKFSNSISVRCLVSAFGEIYTRRMTSYLNQNYSTNQSTHSSIVNNNQDSPELSYYDQSNIRPPGLILDSEVEKYPSNYYSDPQLRILIQWISAALVYSSPCSKFSHLANKKNVLLNKTNSNDNDAALNKELKDFKHEISMEHSCSPLICCTNGNSELKEVIYLQILFRMSLVLELQTVVSLVHNVGWTAKDLFYAIIDYFHYRSKRLKLLNNNNDNYSPCFSYPNEMSSSDAKSKTLLTLFDYLILLLYNVQ